MVVVIESPTTSIIDRREKLLAYKKLDNLIEYLRLSQDSISAGVARRDEAGAWSSEHLGPEDELHLISVDLRLPLASLYEGVEFPAQ